MARQGDLGTKVAVGPGGQESGSPARSPGMTPPTPGSLEDEEGSKARHDLCAYGSRDMTWSSALLSLFLLSLK